MVDDYSISSIGGIYDKYSGKTVEVKDDDEFSNGSLDFDGYLKLLVAQMSNQDFNDPMSDSDLLNQMAQYSMMEGIKNMTQQSGISYAASLVGKVVTVSEDGKLYHTGTVQAVTIEKGKPSVIVDGQAFGSSSITDVVTDEAYAALKNFLGKTVRMKGSGEDAPTGVVEGIVFKNGQSFVSVGGEPYLTWQLEIVESTAGSTGGTETGGDGTETGGTEGTEGTETDTTVTESGTVNDGIGTNETGNTPTDDTTGSETVTQSATVDTNSAAYGTRSQALADVLMKELDKADGTAAASETEGDSIEELKELVKTAYVEVPTFSAALYADAGEIKMFDDDGSVYFGDDVDNLKSVSMDEYNLSRGVTNDDNSDTTVIYGDDSWKGTTATQAGWTYSDFNSENTSPWGSKVKGVTTPRGTTKSDDVPHRISVEKYPEEAALADSYGTRMYDIRYIKNTAITSRIKTDEVIGRMSSGLGITEIGFSGTGQLGEVVTFETGEQRVEILLKSGKSAWHYTTGRFTLDQICAANPDPNVINNLSPQETAIRHFSRVDRISSNSNLLYN